jgi:cytochrome c5
MKKLNLKVTLFALASSLILVPSVYAGDSSDSSAKKPAFDALAFARGAKVWSATCGSCHNIRDPKELSDADWKVAVGQMRVRAGLTAKQAREIEAFLKASN